MTVGKKAFYPSIPRTNDPAKRLPAITENLEILTGTRGNGLDKAVTWRELVRSGAFEVRQGSRGVIGGGGELVPVPPETGGSVANPTKPEGVTATGGFTFIMVQWVRPTFPGFAYAEIWRSTDDDFGTAVRVATTEANLYSDPVELESAYYYWVRFVNVNGVAGPLNGTAGTYAETARDIEKIRQALEGAITESQIAEALNERINLVDAGAEVVGSVSARIAAEASARIQADGVLNTAILDEQTARSDGDAALAADVTALYTAVGDNAAAILAEQTARSDGDSALAQDIANLGVTVGDNSAAILAEQTARADGDSALASSISSLSTTVDGNTSSISSLSTVTSGLAAEYMVKLDVNGYVSGFGLYNQGAGASGFVIHSDHFAIGRPGQSNKYPFIMGTVNGVSTIVLNAATFIADATITSAKIQSLSADKLVASTGTIAQAIIGSGHISNAMIGNIIQSNTFSPTDGVGWRLNKNGLIEAAAIVIRDNMGNVLLSSNGTIAPQLARNSVTRSTAAPSGGRDGDFWYRTTTKILYTRVSGSWVRASNDVASVSELDNDSRYVRTYHGAQPSSSGRVIGDLWVSEVANDTYLSTFRWNGSGWTKIHGRMAVADQITPANASTFIADLAVNTLQIANNAVTVPAGASVDANSILPTFWWSISGASVTVNWGPNPPSAVIVMAFANYLPEGGSNVSVGLRVRSSVGGVGGEVGLSAVNGNAVAPSTSWRYTGQSGTCTYSLETFAQHANTYRARVCGLTVLGVRK